eukprot:3077102-Karenia_brevis.AAC.1
MARRHAGGVKAIRPRQFTLRIIWHRILTFLSSTATRVAAAGKVQTVDWTKDSPRRHAIRDMFPSATPA